jgi:Glycosyl transferase family 2
MKIDLYMTVWNESKILPFTLDYYSRFCDRIFIYDNMSNDNSMFFYRKYKNINLRFFDTNNQASAEILKWIRSLSYREFSRNNDTDWAIICDCDEFLYHENMIERLQELKNQGIDIIECDGREMVSDKFPEYDGRLLPDIVKFGSPFKNGYLSKAIVINPKIDINYNLGSHAYQCTYMSKFNIGEFKLLHYKYLGLDYVLERSKQLFERRSDFNKQNKLSLHWDKDFVEKNYQELFNKRVQVIN